MENEMLGIKLKTFFQIITFLVLNELKSARALANVAGLSEEFVIPRKLSEKKKRKSSKEKKEESDVEMPDASKKRKGKEKNNKNEDDAWIPRAPLDGITLKKMKKISFQFLSL